MSLPSQRTGSSGPSRTDPVFRILTVCSGNLCRSPQAEQLLRARIPAVFDRSRIDALSVTSAGTMAYDGDPMDPHAAAEASRLGINDTDAHRARRIRAEHVGEVDLVLGLAKEHRAAAASLYPKANRRVFTLVEFARIVEALASGELDHDVASLGEDGFAAFMRRVVDAAATSRGLLSMAEGETLDIEDPYRRKPGVYRRSADALSESVERLALGLRRLAVG